MIWESGPWKDELQKHAAVIERFRNQKYEKDTDHFELEKAIFYSAFTIRKLIEGGNISDKCCSKFIDVHTHPSLRNKKDDFIEVLVGPYEVDKEYDLSKPTKTRFSINEICGEIIHSFGLVWFIDDRDSTFGMFVCSYKHQDDRVVFVEFEKFIGLINLIIKDEVKEHLIQKDLKTGKIKKIRR